MGEGRLSARSENRKEVVVILLLDVAAVPALIVAVTTVAGGCRGQSAFLTTPHPHGGKGILAHRLCNALEQGKGSAGVVFPDLSPLCFSSPSKTAQIQILL